MVKMTELENLLYEHAERVKSTMTAPFDTTTGKVIDFYSEDAERTSSAMKSKKIFSLIVIAAILACVGTAFAASGALSGWFSGSFAGYESLPSEEQYVDDIGYEPVLIESFENGYAYKSGHAMDNNIMDDSGESVESFKSALFEYEKDGDSVFFSQEKYDAVVRQGSIVASVDGCDIYYHSYLNKVVPENYQMSEEDKQAEENGDIVFSWGSDEVMVMTIQSIQWTKDGINFMLMQTDGKLTADELVAMAKEAIGE